ncbi:DUF4876 domain-containing protein [Rapidithrix thailandica]|uniref:DUF4876 domain-containing protein n=1 Tax=Rapidithrix thailandica TaxID=413964 RepID=A0AAW9SC97_9BACT
MKHLFVKAKLILKKTLGVMLLLSLITACKNDSEEDNFLGSMEIQLTLKEGLSNISLENVTVKIVNTIDNSEQSHSTDDLGKVMFLNIPAGTYTVTVSEAREEEGFTLSSAKSDVQVLSQERTQVALVVNAVMPSSGLLIKELYYGGANDGYVSLFKDQFIELFNNSSEVLYADGLYIANLYGETGASNHQYPLTNVMDIREYVYADFVDQVPGDGDDYPVLPGKSIVIALNAKNFKEGNPKAEFAVDNTDATLERYSVDWLESQGRTGNAFFDFDNPDVPNMQNIYISSSSSIYLFNSYGAGVVIFRKEKNFTENDIVTYIKDDGLNKEEPLLKIPVADVLDGVDFLENSQAAQYKRVPENIDTGFNFLKTDGGAFYSSISMRRKVDETASQRFGRVVLMDTNNSGEDFEAIGLPDKFGYNQLAY